MTEPTRTTPYLKAVDKVLETVSPARRMSPAQLLNYWLQFVDAAVRGYPSDWYQFDNERGIRSVIQAILDDPEVRTFPEAEEWTRAVTDVDQRYRAILVPIPNYPGDRPWWLAQVPMHAGKELASDLRRMYHIEVETLP